MRLKYLCLFDKLSCLHNRVSVTVFFKKKLFSRTGKLIRTYPNLKLYMPIKAEN